MIDLLDRRFADPDHPLEGTVWQIDGIIDGDAVSSVPGEVRATVRFEDGRVAVEVADCNEGGADVEIGSSTLRVGPLVMTEPACAGAPVEVEAVVVAVLEGRIDYAIEAAPLTLTSPSGKGLVLRAVA